MLSLILAGLSSWLVIWLSDNAKTGTVDRLIIRFDIPWLRAFVGVLFSLLYFFVAVIMFAGISSLCNQMFGINKVVGSAIAGMYTFRHKTKHWYFVYGMPVIFLIQVLIILLIYFAPVDLIVL